MPQMYLRKVSKLFYMYGLFLHVCFLRLFILRIDVTSPSNSSVALKTVTKMVSIQISCSRISGGKCS